jgi:hypothetical protein
MHASHSPFHLSLTALDRYWARGGQWGEGGGRVRAFMKRWAVLVWKMFSVPPTNLYKFTWH